MKTCANCKRSQPAGQFYRSTKATDGLGSWCRNCVRIAGGKWRRANRERHRAMCKDWEQRNPERRLENSRRQYQRNPKRAFEKAKRWQRENPEKRQAHIAVMNAIASGKLVKPAACSSCGGKGRIEGHHDDYSLPFQVEWLCRKCHAAKHKRVGVA